MAHRVLLTGLAVVALVAVGAANDIYIAQAAAGAANGSDCGNAYAYTFFNSGGNWGSSPGQIGPGTTVHLCGTITTFNGSGYDYLNFRGSGTAGHPITLQWEPGAKISVPSCGTGNGCVSFAGRSYLVFDGGRNGILESTDNGTQFGHHDPGNGLNGRPCNYCEFRKLTIQNLYVHTSVDDNNPTGAVGIATAGPGVAIHDVSCHDARWCFDFIGGFPGDSVEMYNLKAWRTDHCFVIGYNGPYTLDWGKVHDNECYDPYNWDTSANTFHHDGLHAYFLNGATANSLHVYNNHFHGNWGANSTGNVYIQGGAVTFYLFNNLFTDRNAQGTYKVRAGGTNCYIFNNTFQTASTGPYDHIYLDGCTQTTFVNNVVINGYRALWFGNVTAPTAFAANGLRSNVYWGLDGRSPNNSGAWRWDDCAWVNFFRDWVSAVNRCQPDAGGESGSTIQDPKLSANWFPLPGSSAIGIGRNLTNLLPAANFDKNGNLRPASGSWDAGAFNAANCASSPAVAASAAAGR